MSDVIKSVMKYGPTKPTNNYYLKRKENEEWLVTA